MVEICKSAGESVETRITRVLRELVEDSTSFDDVEFEGWMGLEELEEAADFNSDEVLLAIGLEELVAVQASTTRRVEGSCTALRSL